MPAVPPPPPATAISVTSRFCVAVTASPAVPLASMSPFAPI